MSVLEIIIVSVIGLAVFFALRRIIKMHISGCSCCCDKCNRSCVKMNRK